MSKWTYQLSPSTVAVQPTSQVYSNNYGVVWEHEPNKEQVAFFLRLVERSIYKVNEVIIKKKNKNMECERGHQKVEKQCSI